MVNKIAIVTTFPTRDWDKYAKTMVQGIGLYWPEDIDFFVQLDEGEDSIALQEDIKQALIEVGANRAINLCVGYDDEHRAFLERNKNHHESIDSKDYRFQYVKFSYKIFAIKKAMDFAQLSGYTHLIWMDADVMTHKRINHAEIERLLPSDEEGVSYLGRKDWDHSECGFMGFSLDPSSYSYKLIGKMHEQYVTDAVLTLDQWHDSYVFDLNRKRIKKEDQKTFGKNLTRGVAGRDVFDRSILSEWMDHYKGNRKDKGIKSKVVKNGAINIDNVTIQTQNCVQNDIIHNNISENLTLIDNWVEPLKPTDEEVILVSAGHSLNAVDFINPDGSPKHSAKIVCVKHAIDRLQSWNIKPWACILLDPRPHVEDFVKDPDPDVIYFVASMVNPAVVRRLKEANAKVIGYHAAVGSGEEKLLSVGTKMVAGGSATATRGISLLEILGFKTFHLYGYDLCSYEEPNLQETKANGKLMWEKINLSVKTWGDKEESRTFWTKGEFLAQAKEFTSLYFPRKSIKIHTYGDGMIPWLHRNEQATRLWESYKYSNLYNGKKDINEFLVGINGSEPNQTT